MQIKIRLHGPLVRYASQPNLHSVDVVPGLTLGQLIDQLEVPGSSVAFIAVNGVKRRVDYKLKENDQVLFFPYVAGG